MSRTKGELSRLQDEEAQLEQSLLSGRVQLDSIVKSLKTTQEEINQVGAEWRAEDALSEPRRWTQDLACKDSLCVRKGGKKRNLLRWKNKIYVILEMHCSLQPKATSPGLPV